MTAPTIDRTAALHELGTDVSSCKTAGEALVLAGIAGMNVTKAPVYTAAGKPVRDQYALVDADGEPLEKITVGKDFTVVNYETVAETLDIVAERTGAVFDACGTLDVRAYGLGGARAFISMKLPDEALLGGVDPVERYLVGFMNHGAASNILGPTATRVWCANQQPQISANPDFKIVIRHTTSAPQRTADAQYALDASVKSMALLAREAEEMLAAKTTDEQFRAIVAQLYPQPENAAKATATRLRKHITDLEVLRHAPTNANIVNTAWGDYQTITEYSQWRKQVKVDDPADTSGIDVLRARRALVSGTEAKLNVKAYTAIREMAGLKV